MRRRYSIVIAPIATHFTLTTKRNNLVFKCQHLPLAIVCIMLWGARMVCQEPPRWQRLRTGSFGRFSALLSPGEYIIRVLERNYLGLRRHLRYGRNGTPCSYHNILEVSASTSRNRLHYAMGSKESVKLQPYSFTGFIRSRCDGPLYIILCLRLG